MSGVCLGFHRDREPDVGGRAHDISEEFRRRHADDSESRSTYQQLPAYNGRIAAEPALPIAVTDEHNRRGTRDTNFPGAERPANQSRKAEDGKIVAGNKAAAGRLIS